MGKLAQSKKREQRERRTQDIHTFLMDTGYQSRWFNPYQVRIYTLGGNYDFYPTGGRVFKASTGEWGSYDTLEDIYRITNE